MTIDLTQPHPLARGLREFVATGSGLTAGLVIPGNDKGPRPKVAYASVLLLGDERRGFPEVEERADGDIVRTPRAAEWSVQWYREGASARALRFVSWIEGERGIDAAAAARFSVLVPASITRLDEIAGDAYEERGPSEPHHLVAVFAAARC